MTRKNYSGATAAYTLNGEPAMFCRSCGLVRNLTGGKTVYPRSSSRSASPYWRCGPCNERRNLPQYARRAPEITRT